MRKLLIFRHLALSVVAVSTLLALASCQKGDDNVQLFRDAALQLDNTRHTLTDEFDYWPGGGISAAPVFASYMNLSAPPRDYYPFWDLNHLYFWARRWSDGTIDLFYKALSTVFKAYYPTYDFDLDRYWQEPEYYDYEEDEL